MIAYYRVSTKRQGDSGLGLEAQRAAVLDHVERAGCSLIAEYQEVESGRKDDRPELTKAIAHARAAKATLIVAKLDRLSRRALYVLQALQDAADVPFVICDLPGATPLTIGIYALIAQEEAEKISTRTKAALAARKARGEPLGVNVTGKSYLTAEGATRGRVKAAKTHRENARRDYEHLVPRIREMRAQGLGFHTIAKRLGEQGFTSRRGLKFTATQVSRILALHETVVSTLDRAMTPGRSRAELEAYATAREERDRALD